MKSEARFRGDLRYRHLINKHRAGGDDIDDLGFDDGHEAPPYTCGQVSTVNMQLFTDCFEDFQFVPGTQFDFISSYDAVGNGHG